MPASMRPTSWTCCARSMPKVSEPIWVHLSPNSSTTRLSDCVAYLFGNCAHVFVSAAYFVAYVNCNSCASERNSVIVNIFRYCKADAHNDIPMKPKLSHVVIVHSECFVLIRTMPSEHMMTNVHTMGWGVCARCRWRRSFGRLASPKSPRGAFIFIYRAAFGVVQNIFQSIARSSSRLTTFVCSLSLHQIEFVFLTNFETARTIWKSNYWL